MSNQDQIEKIIENYGGFALNIGALVGFSEIVVAEKVLKVIEAAFNLFGTSSTPSDDILNKLEEEINSVVNNSDIRREMATVNAQNVYLKNCGYFTNNDALVNAFSSSAFQESVVTTMETATSDLNQAVQFFMVNIGGDTTYPTFMQYSMSYFINTMSVYMATASLYVKYLQHNDDDKTLNLFANELADNVNKAANSVMNAISQAQTQIDKYYSSVSNCHHDNNFFDSLYNFTATSEPLPDKYKGDVDGGQLNIDGIWPSLWGTQVTFLVDWNAFLAQRFNISLPSLLSASFSIQSWLNYVQQQFPKNIHADEITQTKQAADRWFKTSNAQPLLQRGGIVCATDFTAILMFTFDGTLTAISSQGNPLWSSGNLFYQNKNTDSDTTPNTYYDIMTELTMVLTDDGQLQVQKAPKSGGGPYVMWQCPTSFDHGNVTLTIDGSGQFTVLN
ncbi:hypothetical protein [Synoicihabitans lomoniglobus]|uniref:Uncharacterized protein n=1 Tax=Synoicihabitans lomoniglobus TaxID=2909285 RepID=A0AAF0A1A2_9BACT|nr:hypothetical protein [Opitutaceae bacterium LMO-M01]WED64852.1 hypothetical protein PXH66_21105 [Opitutaceae bacterium LMO-M01]